MRRECQESLFRKYCESLKQNVGEGKVLHFACSLYRLVNPRLFCQPDQKKYLRSENEYKEDLLLLTVVLFYVSRTITRGGFWKKQGQLLKKTFIHGFACD